MNYGDELDLKLHLSPPMDHRQVLARDSISSTETSPRSSCISGGVSPDKALRYSGSPEMSSMILVGCPRCLMYVMLSENDPKCLKCKSTVLLDFLRDERVKK